MEYALAFVVALVAGLVATPLVIRFALRVGLVDKPNARKIHSTPMPRAGGIAIFVAFAIGFLCTGLVGLPDGFPHLAVRSWHFVAGATVMFVLGLLDDIFDLKPRWKFLAQFGVAAWMIAAGFRIESLGIEFLDHPWILSLVTFVWIAGVTNAVNLIDGMDGLAAGISLLVMGTMTVIAMTGPTNAALLVLVLPLAGATLGFLRFNFNPAKIFMGDCGSLFLGFSLALFSVMNSSVRTTATGFLISIVALGVPLFDTLFSMVRRIMVGRKPFSPDREHTHHKIQAQGFSHRQVVLILYAFTALLCAVSFGLVVSDSRLTGALLLIYPLGAYLLVRRLGWVPRIAMMQLRRQRAQREHRYRTDFKGRSTASRYAHYILQSCWIHWILDFGGIFLSWGFADWITSGLGVGLPDTTRVTPLLLGASIHAVCWVVISFYFKTHNDIWRYIEFTGIGRHVKPVVLSALFAGLSSDVAFGLHWPARFLVAMTLFASVGITLARLAPNFYYSFGKRQSLVLRNGTRAVIFGAGDSGELCQRVITSNEKIPYTIVGFIDDDPMKLGKFISGAKVLGGIEEIESILKKHRFEVLIFSTVPRNHAHRWTLTQRLHKLGVKTVKFNPQFTPVVMATLRDGPDPVAAAQDNLFYKAS